MSVELAKTDRQSFANFAATMQNWNGEEKTQFQKDYAAMQGAERHRVTAMLVGSQDLDLRLAAVSELPENPKAQEVAGWEESTGAKSASHLVVDLPNQDVDQVTTWVAGLPEGKSRSWAMKNLAANWKNYDPAAAETWINSLPPTEREEVRSYPNDPENWAD